MMYGNSGQKIPRQNFVKGIILAHHNHVEPFLSTERTEVPTLEAYLDSLGNALNKKQCLDAAKALTIQKEFITLITEPSGTGKSEVCHFFSYSDSHIFW